jgi:hypothetical protein
MKIRILNNFVFDKIQILNNFVFEQNLNFKQILSLDKIKILNKFWIWTFMKINLFKFRVWTFMKNSKQFLKFEIISKNGQANEKS